MGCWNGTCGLTQMPILEGEEVILYMLQSTTLQYLDLADALTDTGSLYTPYYLPFFGTYDDYGSINLSDKYSDYHQTIFNAIKKNWRFADVQPTTVEDFIRKVERGDMKNSMYTYNQMMVKRSAWETMIDEYGSFESSYRSTAINRREQVEGEVQDILEVANFIREGMQEAEKTGIRNSEVFIKTHELQDMFMMIGLRTPGYQLSSMLEDPDSHTPEVITQIVNLSLMDNILSYMRKGWTAQFGMGSQDSEVDLHATLARYMIVESGRINDRFNEDY